MLRYHAGKEKAIHEFEYKWLVEMAMMYEGNVSLMAEYGDMDRSTLYRIMRKHGVTQEDLFRIINPGSSHDDSR